MARIRTIKPGFFFNEELAALPPFTRLFFIGLWTQVDREGRCEDRPVRLKANLFPYDNVDVEEMILELVAYGHLVRYSVGGVKILAVPNFLKHQIPHYKEVHSILPPIPKDFKVESIMTQRRVNVKSIMTQSCTQEGKGREGKGTVLAPAAQSKVEVQKPLTGIQKVMRAFKEAKGIDADDAEWDTLHFKRFARPAADLLKIFKNDANAAILYVLKKGGELDEKQMLSWGLEAVSRAAATDANVITFMGEKNGRESKPVVANLDDGPRSNRRLASSGSLAGDALRGLEHAAIHPEGPSDMGGLDDD